MTLKLKRGREMSATFKEFDAIVIGSGQGGNPITLALADAGWQVALAEGKHVGGSCINTGCTPTKTMIASARIAHLTSRAADYGIDSATGSVNFSKVRQRKDEVVESFRGGSRQRLLSTPNISLLEGYARFVGKKQLEVELTKGEKEFITADKVIIDTGSSPSMAPIPGLDTVKALDSTSVMELDKLPDHLLVIGGGYVGLEFGQMFRRFGSKVTIVQKNKQLLPIEDQDVAEAIAEILREDGVDVLLGADTLRVDAQENEQIVLTLNTDGKEQTLSGSHLLVATGRAPNTSYLNPEATGITLDKRGFVPVNDQLETAIPGIYAIGDVNGGPAFTHVSYDDHTILLKNILQGDKADTAGRLLPYVVFLDPQLGRVGLTEKAAKDHGYDYRVAKIPMNWVARAIETDETRGLMKVIVDKKTDRIIGAAILGAEGGELMSALQIAMLGNVPYTVLRDGMFAHPTLSESFNTLFGSLESS